MTDLPTIIARKEGRAGWITLNRPKALNALDYEMSMGIENALLAWRDDPEVAVVIIDGAGERAFCAGGDIAKIYHMGLQGDFTTGPTFWREEYRMNATVAEYRKPIVAFMQGFVMGGGVGVGSHAAHRIVGDTTQIAMPETGIGLIPDVGGTMILAKAPGRVGEYLGVTGTRIGAADAIYTGFADLYVPEAEWEALKLALCETGDPGVLPKGIVPPKAGYLHDQRPVIDAAFAGATVPEIMQALAGMEGDFAADTLAILRRNSALSEEATLRLIRMTRQSPDIRTALENEFRFTLRAAKDGDFLEGIRAQIIDKDRNPRWKYTHETLSEAVVAAMLEPVPGEWKIPFED
ncbi:enoyl-CoA hydratase/isomerase family protein [Sedimentimonas flavescens]|uniref:enoyl-CoA hydratase/isomerase family protein n=1 Tax=Sedimentimonas flavescens TaxID=2851012 RepID=UPI001C49F8E7|nr:enoyl-CoA hydratase/isomerase family protein [Sedimentimonas flavescens]MBW0157805.1 enoyl-CoA hydratase/isomerase family protein [Sedimentimonas flavescens]